MPQVGDGVIIDGSKLGLNGVLLTGVVRTVWPDSVIAELPRKIEREIYGGTFARCFEGDIVVTIPNQGHWLGKEMP